MSVNNRKYLTSTGILLKQLNEDPNTGSFHHQQPQTSASMQSQNQMYQHHQQSSAPNYHQSGAASMNQYHQAAYSNMPSYSTGHNQFQPNMFPNPNTIAAAAAIFSKLTNQFPSHTAAVPDIMMLPGSISQQRWQQKPKPSFKQQQKHQQTKKSMLNPSSSLTSTSSTNPSSSSSSSSVIDLPETFGLPSNKIIKTTHPKYSSSNTSIQSSSSSSSTAISSSVSSTTIDSSKSDILIEDKNESTPSDTKSDDIEIIGETYPEPQSSTAISNPMMIQSTALQQATNEENFKNYLAKNYNSSGQLAVASKPQCNFMSNLTCINQLLNECDYYNKLKRRKPYSNIKINRIYSDDDDTDESDDDDDESKKTKVKSKKIIVIDDSNEEMHKPWITSDLIKLIKHRNLLQTKLNENNTKLDANNANLSAADADLLKKFKNLRNKVTKLVKKARKDYLAKYIQESKENKSGLNKIDSTNKQMSTNNDLDADLINNLAKNPAPPPSTTTTTTTMVTTTTTTSNSSSSKSPTTSSSSTDQTSKSKTNLNATVLSLTSELNSTTNQGSFLQNQNNLMMNLYNSYFNQYLQQYQHQQQQAQQIANAAASKSTDDKTESSSDSGYDVLQKQAAYYAQQQRAIQQQLEQSLAQSAQQLVQEIATMASVKSQQPVPQPQPIVYQQFNHQQPQHHLHQHIHSSNQTQPFQTSVANVPPQTPQSLIMPTQTSSAATLVQPNVAYNYNYSNMIVS